jgi:hypothetical protein
MATPHPQQYDGGDEIVQRGVGVVGGDCEHEVRGNKLVDRALPGDVQGLFEM